MGGNLKFFWDDGWYKINETIYYDSYEWNIDFIGYDSCATLSRKKKFTGRKEIITLIGPVDIQEE